MRCLYQTKGNKERFVPMSATLAQVCACYRSDLRITDYGCLYLFGSSLKLIRNLDLLLTVAIGYIGTLNEKVNESIEVMEIIEASKCLYGLAKFTFCAIFDGLAAIFAKSYTGSCSFFRKPELSLQLFFPVGACWIRFFGGVG
jgi:hypothetical protein